MTIPDYETLMLPVLKLFSEGKPNVAACVPYLKQQFGISDEEAAELDFKRNNYSPSKSKFNWPGHISERLDWSHRPEGICT